MTFTIGNIFLLYWCDLIVVPTGFEPWSTAWEVDDKPTELSLPPIMHRSDKVNPGWSKDSDRETFSQNPLPAIGFHCQNPLLKDLYIYQL